MFELAYVEQAASYDQIEEIRIEGTWCLGTCPRYIASIHPDDSYLFCGLKFTRLDGPQTGVLPEHSFQALIATLRDNDFLSRNSVERGGDNCTLYATDGPGAYISVSFATGNTTQLYWYSGCRMEIERTSETRPRPTGLSNDAAALSAIVAHASQLFFNERLLVDSSSLPPTPREEFWTENFPREECGFDE